MNKKFRKTILSTIETQPVELYLKFHYENSVGPKACMYIRVMARQDGEGWICSMQMMMMLMMVSDDQALFCFLIFCFGYRFCVYFQVGAVAYGNSARLQIWKLVPRYDIPSGMFIYVYVVLKRHLHETKNTQYEELLSIRLPKCFFSLTTQRIFI